MRPNVKWSIPVVALAAMLPVSVDTLARVAADVGVEQSQGLPDGVTPAMVEQGKALFAGDGLCVTCHGEEGAGTPVAPSLTDAEWLNIDGSYPAIVTLITTGVAEPKAGMIPMLPKGGSAITEEQVRAVAAYVWSISHDG